MHAGGSNFSVAAKQYPQEAVSAVRVVATCVDGMIYTDTMSSWKIIKKGNRCTVSTFPDSTETFWSDKKKLQRTACDVQRIKLVEALEQKKSKK